MIQLERTVPIRTDQGALERLVPSLRRSLGGVGDPFVEGTTLTRDTKDRASVRSVYTRVSAAEGGTRLVVEEHYENMAWSIYGGVMGVLGGGLGALGTAAFATLFPLAALAGSFLLSRDLFSRYVRKRSGVLRRLMDELADLVERGGGPEGS